MILSTLNKRRTIKYRNRHDAIKWEQSSTAPIPFIRLFPPNTWVFFSILSVFFSCQSSSPDPYATWQNYGGTQEMIRYSSLNEIDTLNVHQLQIAWSYSSGDVDTASHSQIQCNPIIIDSILYGVSPQMKLFALHAGTGKEIWRFDPLASRPDDSTHSTYHVLINSRGVAYWSDGQQDQRLFFTAGYKTYAINAHTGKPIPTFADSGSIDLHNDLDREVHDLFIVSNSPGIVYKDLLIMGSRVEESAPAAPGHIRAFDVRTGKRKWIFHTIPFPGETGYDTWTNPNSYTFAGGANAWSGFSLDTKKGILFVPTGSAAYDFYGGKRTGQNLFANSLIALDANTGTRKWHFQFIHHDLWDKDLPTPPALVTLTVENKKIEAVVQPTKNGQLFLFDRETGTPLFPIKETPVDTLTDLEGEKPWPTQPIPTIPQPFSRQTLTEKDVNPYLPLSSQTKIRDQLKKYRYGNPYILPGKKPSLIFPGFDGGAEWGGPAFDPETGILYVNANEMAWIMEMQENKKPVAQKENLLQAGKRLYAAHCQVCHGADRKGSGNNPSIISIKDKLDSSSLLSLLHNGRRMMPSFQRIPNSDKEAIMGFVLEQKEKSQLPYTATAQENDSVHFMPYTMKGYVKFLSPEGLPAISPPWGTLNAIDLHTGQFVWKIPLGEYEELKAQGIPPTGTENYGGPVVTAGGLVFIAASRDSKIRAFHKKTGKLLWEYTLPAPGFATPSVYSWNGKEYLVIACGGGKLGTASSDTYVAFALR